MLDMDVRNAQETARWREEMNQHRDFLELELEWERKHGVVRDEKETETIEEEKPADLIEEEEILSSETDEQAGW